MMHRLRTAVLVLVWGSRAWALGDVQAAVAGGKLTVVGDDGPNAVQISRGIEVGMFVVTGLEGTAVNGALATTVSDVRKMQIEMNGGQDRVELLDIDLEESLFVKLGGEQDDLLIEGGRIGGKAEIKGGKDEDQITVRSGARFGGKLLITTGKKSDTINLRTVSVAGKLDIGSGSGADSIVLESVNVQFGSETELGTADGNDRVDLIDTDFDGDVSIALGGGDDDLRVEDCDFDGAVRAAGDSGDDELDLRGGNSFDLNDPPVVTGFEDFD